MICQSALLKGVSGIRHAYFTREGGVSGGIYAGLNGGLGSNDDPAKVEENRRRMAAALNVSASDFLTLYQVHSPDVVVVREPWDSTSRPKADAMVTDQAGLALGVTTADCGPVLFVDPQARVIGAAHAGWQGALRGVLEATLDAMETLGAARRRIAVALGPTLSQTNYEVGPEFVARFVSADAANSRYFAPATRQGHALFDLPAYIAARLKAAGVGSFDDVALCTYADPDRFYSYRRSVHRKEADYGRNIHAILLEE
jgi:YfiH family protein